MRLGLVKALEESPIPQVRELTTKIHNNFHQTDFLLRWYLVLSEFRGNFSLGKQS